MKTLCRVLLALLALGAAGPAFAAPVEWYVLGGPVRADLGHDGVQFGTDSAERFDAALGGDWHSTKSIRSGPDIGVGIRTQIRTDLDLAVELRYLGRGAKYKFTDSDTLTHYPAINYALKLDNVEIPVLLVATPRGASQAWSQVEPMLLAGPVISVSVKPSLQLTTPGLDEVTNLETIVSDVHVGGLVGAGVRLRTGTNAGLLLQARFAFDLTNRFRDAGYDMRSRDLSFLVGWAFDR